MTNDRAIEEVRGIICNIINNHSKEEYFIKKLKNIKETSLDVSTNILKMAFINQIENGKIDSPSITKIIFDEVFSRIKDSRKGEKDIHKKCSDLIELFISFCDKNRIKSINNRITKINEEEYHLHYPIRCEGHKEKEYEITYYVPEKRYNPNKKKKFIYDREVKRHYKPKAKNYIPCPNCGKNDAMIIKEKDEIITCNICNKDWQCKLVYVYWCMGIPCKHPLESLSDYPSPQEITLNHIARINSDDLREVAQMASWMNRLLYIIPRAFCNVCEKPLNPKYTLKKSNYHFYKTLYYYCSNSKCSMQDKDIYLNECWNPKCNNVIDSRVSNKKCTNGWYICKNCYGCCQDYHFQRIGRETKGHREQNVMFCPHCGGRLMISKFNVGQLWCMNCHKKLPILIYEHKTWWKWKELKSRINEINPPKKEKGHVSPMDEYNTQAIKNIFGDTSSNVWVRRRNIYGKFIDVDFDSLSVGDIVFVKTSVIPEEVKKRLKDIVKNNNAKIIRKKTAKGHHQFWIKPL